MNPPTLKKDLERLIRRGLTLDYVSESCFEGVKTGNHYQSVALGAEPGGGFRTPRAQFLDMIEFSGKSVLDLGSNLGEISRDVRLRGASFVDGFEYDPFFIELAQMISAYKGASRVSFYRRDITDPATYAERYDIVLGLSVFIYLQSVLDRLAETTDGILVLETHKLTGNLETTYLDQLCRHYPYYVVLGETEWGTNHGPGETRAMIALAKDQAMLSRHLKRALPVRVHQNGDARETRRDTVAVDPARTEWCDRFFAMFPASSPEAVLDAIGGMDADLEPLARGSDLATHVMSGWCYWFLYVKGYVQYRDSGGVDDQNVYYRYMRDVYPRGNHDAGLVSQLRQTGAKERLARRFADLHSALTQRAVPRVTLVVREQPPDNSKVLHEHGTGAPLVVALIDGYHRLFAARLARLDAVEARLVFEEGRELAPIGGRISEFTVSGDRIAIVGHISDADARIDSIELWAGETVLARAVMSREYAQEDGAGFRLTTILPGVERWASEFRLIVTSGWTPVGELQLPQQGSDGRPPLTATDRSSDGDA